MMIYLLLKKMNTHIHCDISEGNNQVMPDVFKTTVPEQRVKSCAV